MYYIFINALCGFLVLLPLLLLKQMGIGTKKKIAHSLGYFAMSSIFCFALLGILSATGVPSLGDVTLDFYGDLQPFRINQYNYVQYVLNVVLFVPFGFFLPLLWKKFRFFPYTVLLGFLFSLSIEVAQLFNYRTTDIDDLISNTLGAVLGYLLFAIGKWIFPRIFNAFHGNMKENSLSALLGYMGLAWAVTFFATPFVSQWVWVVCG